MSVIRDPRVNPARGDKILINDVWYVVEFVTVISKDITVVGYQTGQTCIVCGLPRWRELCVSADAAFDPHSTIH